MSDLLLDDSVAGDERDDFTAKLKAPNIWSILRWDRLLAEMRVRVLERRDWTSHTEPTFRHELARFREVQAAFTACLGPETMDAALDRLAIQHEMAKASKLG